MSKHYVRTHVWENGYLQTLEHSFDSLEEAMLFSNNVRVHSLKVRTEDGEVVHQYDLSALPSESRSRDNTYA